MLLFKRKSLKKETNSSCCTVDTTAESSSTELTDSSDDHSQAASTCPRACPRTPTPCPGATRPPVSANGCSTKVLVAPVQRPVQCCGGGVQQNPGVSWTNGASGGGQCVGRQQFRSKGRDCRTYGHVGNDAMGRMDGQSPQMVVLVGSDETRGHSRSRYHRSSICSIS